MHACTHTEMITECFEHTWICAVHRLNHMTWWY